MSLTLTLWDCKESPPHHLDVAYSWSGYSEEKPILSLFRYVEIHGDRLRQKYLAWIHDLGESQVGGKRLIEQLSFGDGLSYWWMTLFAEKNVSKSPVITDALRLLALEEIVVQKRIEKLQLVSASDALHKIIKNFCQRLNVAYECRRLPHESMGHSNLRKFYRALPQPIRAGVSLARYALVRWPLRRMQKQKWFSSDKVLFFCSYFFHFNSAQAKTGDFHSRYWEGLQDLALRSGFFTNWLQLYYAHDEVPNPQVGRDLLQRFNSHHAREEQHVFLDAYLSWSLLWRVYKHWLRLLFLSWRLREVKHAFNPQYSKISFWPLMRNEWYASMRGPVAIENLLWIELFDRSMRSVPTQKKGLYLCENQAWERAFIHAWRKYGHGQLIAVQHSTVRFWDLRYFADSRTVRSKEPYSMPQADLMALNGKIAVDAYLSVGFPQAAIVECEALRYGYVSDFCVKGSSVKVKTGELKVLILGDYAPSSTINMLRLLQAAAPRISSDITYTMKPHPNYIVKAEDYGALNLNVVTQPLGDILHDFDIAYSSNTTSAAVDAYLAGLPVVIMLDDTELNLSPLRGQSSVCFVSSPEELARTLQAVRQQTISRPDSRDFFFLDPDLPRWTQLLAN